MQKKIHHSLLIFIFLSLILSSCKFTEAVQPETALSTPYLQTTITSTNVPTPNIAQTEEISLSDLTPKDILEAHNKPTTQAPYWSNTEPYLADDIGMSSITDCFNPLDGYPSSEEELTLTLFFKQLLSVESVDLYIKGKMTDIISIDLVNLTSGARQQIFRDGSDVQQVLDDDSPCANLYRIPVAEPIGADIVQIKFKNSSAAANLISVENNGNPYLLQDWLLFWEQNLPSQVVDLALSEPGLIFLGIAPNQIHVYDIEGNLLSQFSLDEGTNITSVELDPNGNLIITDATQGIFWRYSPGGAFLSRWEGQSSKVLAINPVDGNLFTLIEKDGQLLLLIYDPQDGQRLDEILLQQNLGYVALKFDTSGNLIALRNYDSELIQLDTTSGEILGTVPVQKAFNLEFEGSSFTFDKAGNVYVLFSYSANSMAVYRLTSQGELIARYGEIVSDITDGIPEMALCKPRLISVTKEGRYLIIVDDCFETNRLLTYYLGEPY